MSIQTFNKLVARYGKWSAILIFCFVGLPMVFVFGTSFDQVGTGNLFSFSKLGKLGTKTITQDEFEKQFIAIEMQAFTAENAENIGSYGVIKRRLEDFTPQIIHRLRILMEAENLGMNHVSAEQLRDYQMNWPPFQKKIQKRNEKTGKMEDTYKSEFSQVNYNLFIKYYIPRRPITVIEFDKLMKDNLIIERYYNMIINKLVTTEKENKMKFLADSSKIITKSSEVSYIQFISDIKITDEQIKKSYDALKDTAAYMIPEKRQMKIAIFSSDIPTIMVSDKEIKDYFAKNKDSKYSKDEIKVQIIKLDKKINDKEDDKKKLAQLDSIIKQLKSGASFKKLAKEHSTDKDSKDKSGTIDFFDPFKKEYGHVAKDMKKGEIKIKTGIYGHYIVKKLASRKKYDKFNKDIAELIKERIIQEKYSDSLLVDARDLYKSTIKDYQKKEVHASHILIKIDKAADDKTRKDKIAYAQKLLDEIKEKDNLKALVAIHSEDIVSKASNGSLGWFTPKTMVPPFANALISMKENGIYPTLVETKYGVHIIEKHAERNEQPFDSVKEELIQKIKDRKKGMRKEDAKKIAQSLLTKLKKPNNTLKHFETFNAAQKTPVYDTGLIDLKEKYILGLPGEEHINIIAAAKKLNDKNPLSKIIEQNDNFYVLYSVKILPPQIPEFDSIKNKIK
ncbi:MAG: peptidylprolyl isomerase, partial [Lentisphaeria bacterium]|nr:peptidylprolyl isomerase [Lentisphaeria bacterium]